MLILERMEGDVAVIEETRKNDITHFSVSRSLLPLEAKEGDVLVKTSEGRYRIDTDTTIKRRNRVLNLLKQLEEQNKATE
jgi:hypothetical protein